MLRFPYAPHTAPEDAKTATLEAIDGTIFEGGTFEWGMFGLWDHSDFIHLRCDDFERYYHPDYVIKRSIKVGENYNQRIAAVSDK